MKLSIDYSVLACILISTIIIVLYVLKYVKDLRIRVAIILSAASIFIYSGYGIALDYVDNSYYIQYTVALLFFYLPFVILFKDKRQRPTSRSLDLFIDSHVGFLKKITWVYFILLILPLLFPRFRMFDVFYRGISIEDIYDYLNSSASDSFKRLLSTLTVFFKPFFYAYIIFLRKEKPKSFLPFTLFLLNLLIGIMDACYIGRSAIFYNLLLLFFLFFCIKDGEFTINKRQIVTIVAIITASVPFMYAYTFIRSGATAESLSFGDSLVLLLDQEANYPQYYDHILSSPVLQDSRSPIDVLLWLIFLPIPSVIWPSKPTLANDVFTYSITGLHRTDFGYSSLLPSFLGESFMYFGGHFFWVYTFIMGMVFALLLKYLSKSKYMTLFILVLAVRMTAVGRAGSTATIPLFVNGSLLVLILDFLIIKNKKNVIR